MTESQLVGLFALSIPAIIGVVIFPFWLYGRRLRAKLEETGARTTGRVVSTRQVGGGETGRSWQATVEYADLSGDTVRKDFGVARPFEGAVTVLFDPAKPTRAVMDLPASEEPAVHSRRRLMLVAMAGFVVVGGVLLIGGWGDPVGESGPGTDALAAVCNGVGADAASAHGTGEAPFRVRTFVGEDPVY